MRILKETVELRADSEQEAKELIESIAQMLAQKDTRWAPQAIRIKPKSLKARLLMKHMYVSLF